MYKYDVLFKYMALRQQYKKNGGMSSLRVQSLVLLNHIHVY